VPLFFQRLGLVQVVIRFSLRAVCVDIYCDVCVVCVVCEFGCLLVLDSNRTLEKSQWMQIEHKCFRRLLHAVVLLGFGL
jgi:hypothetical protein